MRYRVKDGQAEIPPYLDKQIADVQSLKVWAHHAQHPYAVTMAGPLALVDCNNFSRSNPAHIVAGGHDPVAALNIYSSTGKCAALTELAAQ